MKKIKVYNQIAAKGLALLDQERYRITEDSLEADAVLVRSADLHDCQFSDKLMAVGRAGVGVNNVPVVEMSETGVAVFNAPGANANAVKELVIAAMLMAARNLYGAADFVQGLDREKPFSEQSEGGKKKFAGFELAGKKLGVIGLGAIGVKVANAALGLGMEVYGYDPVISIDHAWHLNSSVHQCERLEMLLQTCDLVSVHVPLVESTRGMLDEARLSLLPQNAILLNFSRGEVVVEAALQRALQHDHLHAYVTDFPTSELLKSPKVLGFPHLGASTLEAEEQSAVQVINNLKLFLEKGSVQDSVNLPNVIADAIPSGISRLAIVNRNQSGMIAVITETLGKHNLNIEDMTNKSRGEIAYTLIDLQGEVADAVLNEIKALPNVLSARLCG